jgi:hypothetical protein
MPLTAAQRTILDNCSHSAIGDAFLRLKSYMGYKRWVGSSNRYRVDTTSKLDKDARSGTINHRHLADYIAASSVLHCMDGWSFLGRALMCHAGGDKDAARHLAYYAELRAAMSLLAAEGIGIFDKHHFVVKASGECAIVPPTDPKRTNSYLRTHMIAWLALEHWGGSSRAADLLTGTISPGGIPLRDWILPIASLTTGLIGSQWLKIWGLDLKHLAGDRNARNSASYRPNTISSPAPLDTPSSSRFLHGLWVLQEPSPQAPFESLDRHLLRLSLERAFNAINGSGAARKNPNKYGGMVAKVLNAAPIEGLYRERMLRFLTRETDPDVPYLIAESQRTFRTSHPRHHVQVLSRAALLLRVATGDCAGLLRAGDIRGTDLEFWWRPLGEERGLWDAGREFETLADLWTDVEAAVYDAGRWSDEITGEAPSPSRWHRECLATISALGGSERVALWGLGL